MKKTFKKTLALGVIAVVWSSCATLHVSTDYDRLKDFSPLKTYALYDGNKGNQTVSTLNKERIENAVKNELNTKGYKEVSSNPDFLVNIIAIVKNKQSVVANTDYDGAYGYGGIYRPYGYWGGMGTSTTTFDVENYKEGSIIIDMIDAKNSKVFWQSIGDEEIDGNVSNPDQKVNAAIAKIMESFPNVGMHMGAKK